MKNILGSHLLLEIFTVKELLFVQLLEKYKEWPQMSPSITAQWSKIQYLSALAQNRKWNY